MSDTVHIVKCNVLNAVQSQEIIALKERIKRLEKSSQQLKSLNNKICEINLKVSQERHDSNVRIKRLEEAGDALLRDNDDMANINQWLKAREAKP
jgi:TolA-binding protein